MAKTASNISTLSYSPASYVYVAHREKSGWRYYDVSDDVVSCRVGRRINSESTFSAILMNPDGKYNGAFSPMDLCTVFARKSGKKKVRLITGYITQVDAYSLFPGNFSFSGKCSLYRLQKLYWDPHLRSSYELIDPISHSEWGEGGWGGFEKLLYTLLTEVGGMRGSDIRIGGVPQDVVDLAREMFEAKQKGYAQAEQMLSDFYGVLQSTGITGAPETAGGSGGTVSATGRGDFTKFDLSDGDVQRIANLCYSEQGSVRGSAAEASLIANRYDLAGYNGKRSLMDALENRKSAVGGFFLGNLRHMDDRHAPNSVVKAVRTVLVDGRRTLPGYVNEHDCFSDISRLSTGGPVSSRSSYRPHETVVYNTYGSKYTFYCFPDKGSDPFGYTCSQATRRKIGEDCYSI